MTERFDFAEAFREFKPRKRLRAVLDAQIRVPAHTQLNELPAVLHAANANLALWVSDSLYHHLSEVRQMTMLYDRPTLLLIERLL